MFSQVRCNSVFKAFDLIEPFLKLEKIKVVFDSLENLNCCIFARWSLCSIGSLLDCRAFGGRVSDECMILKGNFSESKWEKISAVPCIMLNRLKNCVLFS